jgi:branched-chain amino acid transport system ATP-binding protein
MSTAPSSASDSVPVDPLLSISELVVRYGEVGALWGIDFDVWQGSSVAIVGPNGAGKSTLINAISGLIRPAAGQIRFLGHDVGRTSPVGIVRMGISQVPEGRRVFGNLTVDENLLVGAHLVRDWAVISKRLEHVRSLFPKLAGRRSQIASTLSGGEQQMLAIGRALMGEPRLLMLDEPSLGLAPRVVSDVFAALGEIQAAGVTLLLVEQNSRMALRHSDYAYVLEAGRIALSGTSSSLAADPRVVRTYLGGGLDEARGGEP